jgi:hypothetical protein
MFEIVIHYSYVWNLSLDKFWISRIILLVVGWQQFGWPMYMVRVDQA